MHTPEKEKAAQGGQLSLIISAGPTPNSIQVAHMTAVVTNRQEIESKNRFEFGKNWSLFLDLLDEDRISQAEKSLCSMLEVESLAGMSFLDIGSGSGLFSLAARRLGAKVRSFDYDPQSVGCTRELRRRYFDGDPGWVVEEASVLDTDYLSKLGQFDIVYSWGVLHHTGKMWEALANVAPLVGRQGKLFIALYNDQGLQSHIWRWIKKTYVSLPESLRWIVIAACYVPLRGPMLVKGLMRGHPIKPFRTYKSLRGMSLNRDLIDWVGGYPFDVASIADVARFYMDREFVVKKTISVGKKLGCNEFVFSRRN